MVSLFFIFYDFTQVQTTAKGEKTQMEKKKMESYSILKNWKENVWLNFSKIDQKIAFKFTNKCSPF